MQVDALGRVELLVSPASEGPARLAPAAEGAGVHPGALRLPPADDPAAARRLAGGQAAYLPAVSRGKPARTHQAAEEACGPGPRALGRRDWGEPALVDELHV